MGGVAAADEFSMLELLIGLPNIRVFRVEKHDGVLQLDLETAVPLDLLHPPNYEEPVNLPGVDCYEQ
jgi:hypothetical protein